MTPIYTVGDGTRTQLSRREDGQWFIRFNNGRLGWGPWSSCASNQFEFSRYVSPAAGMARLPNAD